MPPDAETGKMPLFNSPRGMVWAWEEEDDAVAHLVSLKKEDPIAALCNGKYVSRWASFQVGGCSKAPCLNCIAKVWAEKVRA